ncbi:MAG: bifunctional riboflavin kinase/FAD synthetase [Eubacteriales bacterium]
MTKKTPAVVALGMFDGVHTGHRALMERLLLEAERLHAAPIVYTFSNHPLEVLGGSVRMLTPIAERNSLLLSLGAERVECVPFTLEFAGLSTDCFVDLLFEEWDVRALVVGYNYTCGDRGAGTPMTLKQIGDQRSFAVCVVDPVICEGEPVSSTRIRDAIERGDVSLARRLLRRPYTLSGVVAPNKRLGHEIRFPTANIPPDPRRAIPAEGVYATFASINGKQMRSVTNIGANPTVNGDKRLIETYILDFNEELYGQSLTVSFQKRLREERAFPSLDALKEQIGLDARQAAALPDDDPDDVC